MNYEFEFFLAIFKTLLIEVPIVFVLLRYVFKNKFIRSFDIVFVSILASVLTLPYIWFIFPAFIPKEYFALIGEFLVFIIEFFIYFVLLKISYKQALSISFIANLLSYLIGKLL